MAFWDPHTLNGDWSVLYTTPEDPFVLGDAPVVAWERTTTNELLYGQGFARPDVEAFLPVFPTACLHILPAVRRRRHVLRPSWK